MAAASHSCGVDVVLRCNLHGILAGISDGVLHIWDIVLYGCLCEGDILYLSFEVFMRFNLSDVLWNLVPQFRAFHHEVLFTAL